MRTRYLLAVLSLSIVLSGCLLAPLKANEERFFYSVVLADEGAWRTSEKLIQGEEVCPVHGIRTVPQEVPVEDGMMAFDPHYMKALVRRFPYSFAYLWSGSCESWGTRSEVRRVCPKCREEEEIWQRRHMTD